MEVIIILTALTKDGEIFIPAHYSRDSLKMMRQNVYNCAECKETLILKVGNIKIPHFAHQHNTVCAQSFSEGESEDHLRGKIQLYDFLQSKKVPCNLEPFILDIKQRPDILIFTDNIKVALEYQCSKIPTSIIRKRNKGYMQVHIKPLWVLKTPNPLDFPLQQIGSMKISAFQTELLYHSMNGKVLITYCPQTKSFSYISNLLYLYSNHFIVKINRLPITMQTWPLAMVKTITEHEFQTYLKLYQDKRMKRLKNLYLYNRKGIQSSFLQVCYKWRINPINLPLFIGVPSYGADAFDEHACEWQLQWIDFLLGNSLMLDTITDQHYRYFLLVHRWKDPNRLVMRIKALKAYVAILLECLDIPKQLHLESTCNYTKMHKLLYNQFLAKGAEN
ncbi:MULTISPECIES: competence protein CoiA family protein [unclassified Psychrobacillus]|uniref:competence protein CoiA n=1 Tax=unclassified Psychrobacillus TaxID=2636677 RepID=UPI00146A95FA|nr:competence protein CoiA family protein [Psychrobacillus sp. BL-248-WT-3]NME07491.1 hypothetical protein [Psychrobacillus sp. BL-248-WT-3]